MITRLEWNLIEASSPVSTASIDIFNNLKSQIINSSSYWELIESSATGSECIILHPLTSSVELSVVIANNITGSSAFLTPDNNTSTANRLHVGLLNGSGTFITANSDSPFSGSNIRWTGYWNMGVITALSHSFIIESQESVFVGLTTTTVSTNYGAFAGALFESYTSGTGENDKRLYGICTSGASAISTNFWGSTSAFISHQAVAGGPHTATYRVINGNPTSVIDTLTRGYAFAFTDSFTIKNDAFASGSLVGFPTFLYSVDANVGTCVRFRECYITSDTRTLVKIMSGSTVGGYTLGGNRAADADTLLLAPASGSGL